jgi:hypothetical protein
VHELDLFDENNDVVGPNYIILNTNFKLYNILQTLTPYHIPQTTFALSRGRGRGRTTCRSRGRVQPAPQGLPTSSILRVAARG